MKAGMTHWQYNGSRNEASPENYEGWNETSAEKI